MVNQSRKDALVALLVHAHEILELKFGFRLWDETVIPENWPESEMAIQIADEGVIAALVRQPKT